MRSRAGSPPNQTMHPKFKIKTDAFRPEIALPVLVLNALERFADSECTRWISEEACPANVGVTLNLVGSDGEEIPVPVRLCDLLHNIGFLLRFGDEDEEEGEDTADIEI